MASPRLTLSERMARIKKKDTAPEMIVRRTAHRMGYRFRLHRTDLPGTPDLTFPARNAVVLVHGCFWHQHADPACKLARMPKSRPEYWGPKLQRNQERDIRNREDLRRRGWRVLEIWECQTADPLALETTLLEFLEGPPHALLGGEQRGV
jgi:DNA mismatch endonuclease (patch repair protein)